MVNSFQLYLLCCSIGSGMPLAVFPSCLEEEQTIAYTSPELLFPSLALPKS
jgi:hypothetical protein